MKSEAVLPVLTLLFLLLDDITVGQDDDVSEHYTPIGANKDDVSIKDQERDRP